MRVITTLKIHKIINHTIQSSIMTYLRKQKMTFNFFWYLTTSEIKAVTKNRVIFVEFYSGCLCFCICFFSESFSSNYNKLQKYRFLYFKIYIFLYHFCLCKLNKKDKLTILPFFVCVQFCAIFITMLLVKLQF